MGTSIGRTFISTIAGLMLGAVANGTAQTTDFLGNEAAISPIVRGLPYSADAVTTLTHTLADGTRIERTVTARLYRDSAGRVRREQTILGLASLNAFADARVLITIVDPVTGLSHILDPEARTARRTRLDRRSVAGAPPPPPPPPPRPRDGSVGPGAPPPPPPAPPRPQEEAIGSATIAGIKVTGRRSRLTIPPGHIGNDRAFEILDERWDSTELRLLAQSRHVDPRTGVIEYRLVTVTRAEPPADLFAVPGDYTVVDASVPPPPPPAPPRRGR
jgi:hypothetical protein